MVRHIVTGDSTADLETYLITGAFGHIGSYIVEELIKTIIHEYQHYLQSPSWYTRHCDRNLKNYFDHPYEAEAEEVANKYWKVCKMEIEKKSS